jgi:hypothetical protein
MGLIWIMFMIMMMIFEMYHVFLVYIALYIGYFGSVSIQRLGMIMGAVLYIRIGSTEYEQEMNFM